MAILSHPAFGPRTSLAYITAGTLMDVWTAVWYFCFVRPEPEVSNTTWFWLAGLFLTGLTLIVIGMLLGPIGQAARRAELPPSEALNKEAAVQQTAAAAGVVPMGGVVMQPGQVIVPAPVAPAAGS